VRVSDGSGKFVVNGKEAAAFFNRPGDMQAILSPLATVGNEPSTYDISVVVSGGGVSGQTSSVMLGLARALVKINAEWTSPLRKAGLLTRDARIKERKKPGLKKARKAPTYTKR
jgi:small subunit ribosomal protein S9